MVLTRFFTALATVFFAAATVAQTPLDPGVAAPGALATAHQTVSYTLSGQAGDSIAIRLTRVDGAFWPHVKLLDTTGALLAEGSDTTTVDMLQPVPATGTYTIAVYDGFNGSLTGTYSIYAQIVNRPGHATAILPGQSVLSPTVTAGGFASFTLSAQLGDVILARAATASGAIWPALKLYDPNGTLVDSAKGSGLAELNTTLSTSGTFTILIGDGFDGTKTGTFGLYTQLAGRPTADPFPVGASVAGSIDGIATMRTYTVQAVAGDAILARMSTASGNLWPMIRLYDPNGVFLAAATSSLSTDFARTVGIAGTYTLIVGDGFSGAYTGQYNMFVQKPAHPQAAADLGRGTSLKDTIPVAGAMKTYTLTVPPAGVNPLLLHMTRTDGNLWPLIRLYDSFGNKIKETYSNTGAAVLNAVVFPSRTYEVVVGDGHDGTGTGGYTLDWNLTVPGIVRSLLIAGGASAAAAADPPVLNVVNSSPSNDCIDLLDAVKLARTAWGL